MKNLKISMFQNTLKNIGFDSSNNYSLTNKIPLEILNNINGGSGKGGSCHSNAHSKSGCGSGGCGYSKTHSNTCGK